MRTRSLRRSLGRPRLLRPWALAAGAALAPLLLSGCMSMSSARHDLPDFTTAAGATGAAGAPIPAGTTVQTFTGPDGTAVQYVQVVPPGRASGQPGKVLITFPPGGQELAITQKIVADTWQAEATQRGWVVISPAAPAKGPFYEAGGGDLVEPLLGAIGKQFPPEGGKFDLAGVSNGGLSAFRAALGRPEQFRSLVVFPGVPPTGADPALTRLTGIGAAFFVGAQDTEWLTGSKTSAAALRKLGNRVDYVEVPDTGHILPVTGADLFDAMEKVRG